MKVSNTGTPGMNPATGTENKTTQTAGGKAGQQGITPAKASDSFEKGGAPSRLEQLLTSQSSDPTPDNSHADATAGRSALGTRKGAANIEAFVWDAKGGSATAPSSAKAADGDRLTADQFSVRADGSVRFRSDKHQGLIGPNSLPGSQEAQASQDGDGVRRSVKGQVDRERPAVPNRGESAIWMSKSKP